MTDEIDTDSNCEPGSPNKNAEYHAHGQIIGVRVSKMNGEVFEAWACDTCQAHWEMSAEVDEGDEQGDNEEEE